MSRLEGSTMPCARTVPFKVMIALALLTSYVCVFQVEGFNHPNPHISSHSRISQVKGAPTSNALSPSVSFLTPLRTDDAKKFRNFEISVSRAETEDHKSEHNPISIYKSYLTRLWDETSGDARRKIAKDKAKAAIKKVIETFKDGNYNFVHDSTLEITEARQDVLNSCNKMLTVMESSEIGVNGAHTSAESLEVKNPVQPETNTVQHHETTQNALVNTEVEVTSSNETPKVAVQSKKKKPSRSILFGAGMGAAVACWVFSGNYIFTGLFTLMTALGQLEYYRMVMNTGAYPARKISVVGACAMFITALFAPNQHQIVLPTFATLAMMWFLTIRRQVTTISDIATTFTGMFYLGYIPSFWVRTRVLGANRSLTRLATFVKPMLDFIERISGSSYVPNFIAKSVHLPITSGSVFIFWTWLCIAFSDVGAYFSGRNFGKTKLGKISPAAGATSPNKTVEGAIGGCIVSAMLGTLGAWVMKWPLWYVTGPLHGINLALLGLIGDLTASMLKRDAGLKDFGDLIPEHGGILDRVDSFIFTAPYSWLVCAYAIPWLKKLMI